MVDEYCSGCKYLGILSKFPCCLYMDITGQSRGCPPGLGCTQRSSGPKIRKPRAFSILGSIARNRKKNEPPKPTEKPAKKKPVEKNCTEQEYYERERNRKKLAAARTRASLQGKQTKAIRDFKKEHNITSKQLAKMVGVSESTINKWTTEYVSADWEKLTAVGVVKPDF